MRTTSTSTVASPLAAPITTSSEASTSTQQSPSEALDILDTRTTSSQSVPPVRSQPPSSSPPGYEAATQGAPGVATSPPSLQQIFDNEAGRALPTTPPTTALGDIYAAVGATIRAGNRHAETLLQHASHDGQPLITMSGQIATAHGLVIAFGKLAHTTPQILEAVKKVVVPLERALAAVQTVFPELANKRGLRHEIRKALMREMDPVRRTVLMYRGMTRRSMSASLFRNSPDRSGKFAEKLLQYSGHPPFPTSLQADAIAHQAMADTVPKPRQALAGAQLQEMYNSYFNHDIGRSTHFDVVYKGRKHTFLDSYFPAHTLRNTATLRPQGIRMPQEQLQQIMPPLYARIAELTNLAEQAAPPSGDALALAVQGAWGRTFTNQQRALLGRALERAMAPHTPAQLFAMAHQAGRGAGAPDEWLESLQPPPAYTG